MKAIQKIVRNGNSAQVTIPRAMLFALDLRPGELVELTLTPDNELHVRRWISRELVSQSPGVLAEAPPAVASR